MSKLDKGKISGLTQKKPSAKPISLDTEKPSVGYSIGNQTASQKLKRTHVFLTPDIVSFIDDFVYEVKKEKGIRVTTSELTRVAIRAFRELPREKQVSLLMD